MAKNELVTTFTIVEGNSPQKIHSFENSLKQLNENIDNLGKNADFGKRIPADFDKLQTKAASLQKDFNSLAKTRIDSGNVGNLTKEVVRASERSRQLTADILNIKSELANPNRKSSIAFLTEELKGAEREADQLSRKLNSLTGAGAGGSASGDFTKRFGSQNRLSSFQKTQLSYQVNDVLTGIASGQPLTQIAAQQSGQIAQIFSPAQASALVAAYAPLVAILGAGVASIALTYKITGDLRAEAEKRLKVEEMIAATVNKQILGQKESLALAKWQQAEAERTRQFSDYLGSSSIDQLKANKATFERLRDLMPGTIDGKPNESFQRLQSQILLIDAQIYAKRAENEKKADEAFNRRWEARKKSEQNAVSFSIAAENKLQAEQEKGRKKVEEIEKQYNSLFDSIYQKSNSNNPFVQLFSEADKSLKILRENSRGLSKDIIAQFEAMETKAANMKLFEARLDNRLSSFGLRADAANFRNPFDQNRQTKEQNEFIDNFLRNNPNYLFLQNKTEVDDDVRRDILRRSFNPALTETPADRLNKSLEDQFRLIYDGKTPQDIADRRFNALTQGANPLELSDTLRERAAQSREREATRYDQRETKAAEQRDKQIEATEKLTEAMNELKKVAEEKGLSGVIEILDKSNGAVEVSGAKMTAADTARAYREYQGAL